MPRRRQKRVEPRPPRAAQLTYQRLLTRARLDLERLLRERLYPALPGLLARDRAERGIRTDSALDDLVRIFSGMTVVYGQVYSDAQMRAELGAIGGLVGRNAKKESGRQLAAIGLAPVVSDVYTPQLLRSFVKENVGLVRSVTTDQLPALEQIVTGGFRRGIRVEQIQKEIQARLKVSRSKAALLARDQVFKLQGEFIRVEQTEAGIRGYIWRTVKDGKVRDFHVALEGTKQSWSKPPVVSKDGRQAHPGGDYQCRCYPEPDFETLVLDDPAQVQAPQARAPGASAAALALQAGFVASVLFESDENT